MMRPARCSCEPQLPLTTTFEVMTFKAVATVVLVCIVPTLSLLRHNNHCHRISPGRRQQHLPTVLHLDSSLDTNDSANPPILAPLLNSIQTAVLPEDGTEATRLFHGRGGMYEGCQHITLDWFPTVWLLTSHLDKVSENELRMVQQCLEQQFPLDPEINLVYQHRAKNASETFTSVVSGEVPDSHVISENGLKFLVQLPKGQNQGIFLDMAIGRAWVKQHAEGKRVLNLFAYTCGFSVAALAGGADEVINVDMARGPLKMGQRNHELNALQQGARFLAHDIFKTWGKIKKNSPYDLIVVDPPSFQKGSFVAKKDYQKILRRIPGFLEENGFAMICLNAPELDTAWLEQEVQQAAPELAFVARLENPSTFPAKDPERALKVLIFKKSIVEVDEMSSDSI